MRHSEAIRQTNSKTVMTKTQHLFWASTTQDMGKKLTDGHHDEVKRILDEISREKFLWKFLSALTYFM